MPDRLDIAGLFRWQGKRSVLGRQVEATLCPGMKLPTPIEKLFCWIEDRRYFSEMAGGRIGYLSPKNEAGRIVGPCIQFAAKRNAGLEHWFGNDDPAVIGRLCVFAKTGGDGSMAAFWLDDAGKQTIVHLGSGSGSVTVCTLADDPIDFLRLLAIGYDEICCGDEYAFPPDQVEDGRTWQNMPFLTWVEQTFKVTVPDRGTAIVPTPASMLDATSADPFWQWVQKSTA